MKLDPTSCPNINALWSALILEELRRLGVRDVVVCPGSRNTPLVAAAIGSDGMRITSVVDERAAAYFALGCAKNLRPVVVVTTSGTAVMNLLPAVTEARQSGVPLIVLSADRPRELRDCGANQTIDQLGPLRPIVKWQNDLPAPNDRLPARLALTTVDQAVRTATSGFPGPVQINCAFGEPLAPSESPWDGSCLKGTEAWLENGRPFVEDTKCEATFDPAKISELIAGSRRGLVVVGNTPGGAAAGRMAGRLAEHLNWPVIADPTSSIRTGNCPKSLIRHADFFEDLPNPDLVLQFGSRLVSRKIEEWLEGLDCRRILVDPADGRRNPGHGSFLQLTLPVEAAARSFGEVVPAPAPNSWLAEWRETDERVAAILRSVIDDSPELTEAFVARQVAESELRMFAGNSLPIRHLNLFADPFADLFADGSSPRGDLRGDLEANRGASGIDGIVATACGMAAGCEEPVVLLIGDLSLLHDLNSLGLAKSSRQKIIIVLINNGGGGIFNQLPIAEFPDLMTPLCDGEHDMEFCGIAAEFGLSAWRCSTREEWSVAWQQAQAAGESCLVEAICPRSGHGSLLQEIRDRLADG